VSSRWRILPRLPTEHPLNANDYPPLLKQALYNRGIADTDDAELFFSADHRLSHDPWLMPDIEKAVQRIQQGLLRGEKIAVYGDFDVDGICATALMAQGLRMLGADVVSYIPHRLQEGHGLNSHALAELHARGVSLVITADCGISGTAQSRGMHSSRLPPLDMVITDHHLPPTDGLPPAVAIVDPKRTDSRYPLSELAGVGVAFKLLQALLGGLGREDEAGQFLDLVALGTVADLMPLTGENRFLVTAGLEHLRNSHRPGIRELAAQAGLKLEKLDAQDISFALAPRLNAAGRLEHAISAYNLLMTNDDTEAMELAAKLCEQNIQRQRLTSDAMKQAGEQLTLHGVTPVLMVKHPDFAGGILGLIAGRLCDEYYHPAIAMQTGGETVIGSCRSIPEFNITAAISQCAGLLTRFGGHAQAAGFSMPAANLGQFEKHLNEIAAKQLEGLDLRPQIEIDTETRLGELGAGIHALIQKLAPFGAGNAAPVFLSREVFIADYRTMGATGNHLRFKFRQGAALWDAVAFGMGERDVNVQVPLDIVYNLEMDEWNGENRLRLNLLDFANTGTNI